MKSTFAVLLLCLFIASAHNAVESDLIKDFEDPCAVLDDAVSIASLLLRTIFRHPITIVENIVDQKIKIDDGYIADLKASVKEINLDVGKLHFDYDTCKIDVDNSMSAKMTLSVSHLDVNFKNYSVRGILTETVPFIGKGDGRIYMENFQMELSADLMVTLLDYVLVQNYTLDLSTSKAIVKFEGLMPGTDFGIMFNEVFSMGAKDAIKIIQTIINEDTLAHQLILNIINDIAHSLNDFMTLAKNDKLDDLVKKWCPEVDPNKLLIRNIVNCIRKDDNLQNKWLEKHNSGMKFVEENKQGFTKLVHGLSKAKIAMN